MSTSTHSDATAASSAYTLDAVNEILEAIGEPPVDALDTNGNSDEAQAEATLNRWTERILRRGWFQNTIIEKEYTPDGSDQIEMTDVLDFRHTTYSAWLKMAIRNGYLYDTENQRDTWPDLSSVKLDVILDVDFDDLTPALRTYIIAVTAQAFERFKKRGIVDAQLLQQTATDARVAALQEDGDMRQTDLLGTVEARNVLGERRYNKAYSGVQR